MTPARVLPLFALLAAAAVEPRGCSEQSVAPGIARSAIAPPAEPAVAQPIEPGPAGVGCTVVAFQMDVLRRAGVDDGMRSARVCCGAAETAPIAVEARDPSLRTMVAQHGPLRRHLARLCLDPAHPRTDHVTTAPSGELCAGARCARLELR